VADRSGHRGLAWSSSEHNKPGMGLAGRLDDYAPGNSLGDAHFSLRRLIT
jgi:hypothetical protein